ncbi:MAG: hypothetical protein E6J17_05220, partial [Chloroflexi bacterium]
MPRWLSVLLSQRTASRASTSRDLTREGQVVVPEFGGGDLMRRRILTMLAAAMFVAGACGGTAAPSASAPASAGAPSESAAGSPSPSASAGIDLAGSTYKAEPATTTGGTVVMAEWQSVTTMNPYYASANADIEASAPSLEALVDTAQDIKYIPALASEVPTPDNGGAVVNGDNMDVTWKLKPGIKWSDGQPITCADLEATWK